MKTDALSNLEKVAVAKLVKDDDFKELSKGMAPGTYAVHFTIEVTGTLTKGEEGERTRTADVKWRAVTAFILAQLAELNPLEAARVGGMLEEIVGRAARTGDDELHDLEARTGVRAVLDRMQAEVAKLPKTRVAGAIRAKLSAHAVAAADVPAAGTVGKEVA